MQELQEMQVQSLCWEDPLRQEMATPVFLPGESYGQRSLAGYSPRDHKESYVNEHARMWCNEHPSIWAVKSGRPGFQSECDMDKLKHIHPFSKHSLIAY